MTATQPPDCRCGHAFSDHYFDTGSEAGHHGCMARCDCENYAPPALVTSQGVRGGGGESVCPICEGVPSSQVSAAMEWWHIRNHPALAAVVGVVAVQAEEEQK